MLQILAERKFPVSELIPLASSRSVGKTIEFGGRKLPVRDLATFRFCRRGYRPVLGWWQRFRRTCPAGRRSRLRGHRQHLEVPLRGRYSADRAGGEPAGHSAVRQRNIIANPNCSTIQMVVALKPIHDAAGITRINVATYQSVSGAGRRSVETLARQTAQHMNHQAGRDPG
jgi:aspartate-semialdehyde dehydrogenase